MAFGQDPLPSSQAPAEGRDKKAAAERAEKLREFRAVKMRLEELEEKIRQGVKLSTKEKGEHFDLESRRTHLRTTLGIRDPFDHQEAA